MLIKIINLLMIIVFALFIALQFNDPDAVLWIIIYLIPLFASVLIFYYQKIKYIYLFLAIAYFIYGLILIPAWQNNYFALEESREAFGLFICVFWFTVLVLNSKKFTNQ